jgi:crotonobetainyl-CoA:carnitine CoA-transferase CaiB-like acyl-CoA transferase
MWAGPLATWLMQGLGARVHKVEPDARPDGTRAITGGGIYPDGRQVRPGEDSAVWHALNHGKLRLALDLTQPPDRSELIERAGCADVVIDSFSPRVLANFGLDPTRMATAWISMPAFPPGPHRAWVAYGTGIHAASGLGDQEDGTFTSPSVAYPDPVAGFTAAWTLLSILSDGGSGHHEVALASALAPLAARAGPVTPGRPPGLRLFEAGLESGEFLRLEVAGRRLDHPVGPFRNQPALAGNRPK